MKLHFAAAALYRRANTGRSLASTTSNEDDLGSARVSRAGDAVSPSRTSSSRVRSGKDCFGETPKPARETRARPRSLVFDVVLYLIASGVVTSPAQVTGRPFHCQLAGRLVFTTLC